MGWLQRFRNFKRQTPEKASFTFDWRTKEVTFTGNVHPFVTVRADMIKSQVMYAELLFDMYNRFMSGLRHIYGNEFYQLIQEKLKADILRNGSFGPEKHKELGKMMSELANCSVESEDQYDRRRIEGFCEMLEDGSL